MTNRERIAEATRFLQTIFSTGDIVELRAQRSGDMPSGRFNDLTRLAYSAIEMQSKHGATGCYFTVCPLKLDSRIVERHGLTNTLLEGVAWGAGNNDIACRTALLLDVDSARPSGVCSTEAEKAQARKVLDNALAYLRSKGWPEPIIVDSGNGYHAYYRIARLAAKMPAWEYVLGLLGALHNTPYASIDTAVANPGRIVRLPGSMNMKGEDTPDRPHRLVRVLSYPEQWEPVDHGRMILPLAREHGYITAEERRASRPPIERELLLDADGMLKLIAEYPRHLMHSHTRTKDGVTYFYLRSCPNVGRPHRDQGVKTALTLGELGPGFACFSADCAGVKFWDVLRKLQEETGHRCETPIWAKHELNWRMFLAWGMYEDAEAWAEDDDECDIDWSEYETEEEETMTTPTPAAAAAPIAPAAPPATPCEANRPAAPTTEDLYQRETEQVLARLKASAWEGVTMSDDHRDWALTDQELRHAWHEEMTDRLTAAPPRDREALMRTTRDVFRRDDLKAMETMLGRDGLYRESRYLQGRNEESFVRGSEFDEYMGIRPTAPAVRMEVADAA
jgi:hypothetical protein